MKRILIYVAAALAMAACGKKDNSGQQATDSVGVNDSTASVVTKKYYLTADSLGPVKIGMEWKDTPPMVEGLYDNRKEVKSPEAVEFMFENEGRESFAAYDFGEGKVDVICLFDSVVGIQAPRGDIHLGSPFKQVLELPGVTAEWNSIDEDGMWYWVYEGLWIGINQDNLSPALSTRLYNSTQAPTASDFSGNETVGFIGTGLPY